MGRTIPALSMGFLIALSFLVVASQVSGTRPKSQPIMKDAFAQTVTPRITVEPAADSLGIESDKTPEYTGLPASVIDAYPPLPNPALSISRLKEYIAGLERVNKELQGKIEDANRLAGGKDLEIARLKQELGTLDSEYDRLYDTYMKLKADHDAYAQRFAGLAQAGLVSPADSDVAAYARYGFESQIKELTTKIADLTAAKIDLEQKITQSRRERNDMDQERQLVREDLEKEKARGETLERKITALTEELGKKDVEISKLQMPREDLEAEVGTLKVVKEEYERRISVLNSQISAMKSSDQAARTEIARLTALITKLELEHEFALQEKTGEVAGLQKELALAQDKGARLDETVKRQEQIVVDLKERQMGELQDSVARLKKELVESRTKQEFAQRQLQAQERANAQLGSVIKKMRMELEMRGVEEKLHGDS